MTNFYVYIHLNPHTNEIFYVGKGKGNRKTSKAQRNKKWLDYTSQLTEPFKVLVVKDNLTEKEALLLEKKIIQKIDWHYDDATTNVEWSEPDFDSKDVIQINFTNEKTDQKEYLPKFRFKNLPDEEILKNLLHFPNEIPLQNVLKEFNILYNDFYDNYEELEEIDGDLFYDIECVLSSIEDLFTEYTVADKDNFNDFIEDLKRERFDVEIIIDENPKKKQKEFINRLLNWIDTSVK